MDLGSILNEFGSVQFFSILAAVILSLIQVSPLKINPWTWIYNLLMVPVKAFGRTVNAGIVESVESMHAQLDNTTNELEKVNMDIKMLKGTMDEDRALRRRIRILRFGDEIRAGQPHSLEHFDEVLSDISAYKEYCATHVDFKNSKAVATIKCIEEDYKKRLVNNDFL